MARWPCGSTAPDQRGHARPTAAKPKNMLDKIFSKPGQTDDGRMAAAKPHREDASPTPSTGMESFHKPGAAPSSTSPLDHLAPAGRPRHLYRVESQDQLQEQSPDLQAYRRVRAHTPCHTILRASGRSFLRRPNRPVTVHLSSGENPKKGHISATLFFHQG